MSRYCFNTSETRAIKSATKRLGEFYVDTNRVKGTVKIVNYRKYSNYEEVDVLFTGKIYAKAKLSNEWLDSDTIKSMGKNISKVKLNRFIKKALIFDVTHRMNYFGCNLRYYNHIKKIIWI